MCVLYVFFSVFVFCIFFVCCIASLDYESINKIRIVSYCELEVDVTGDTSLTGATYSVTASILFFSTFVKFILYTHCTDDKVS